MKFHTRVTMGDVILQGIKETFRPNTFGRQFLKLIGGMILVGINAYLGYLFAEQFLTDYAPIIYGIGWILFFMLLLVLQILVFNIGKQYIKFRNAGLMK